MAFRWRADDDLTMNAGLVAKKPYILLFFRGGSGLPVTPLWIRPCTFKISKSNYPSVSIRYALDFDVNQEAANLLLSVINGNHNKLEALVKF